MVSTRYYFFDYDDNKDESGNVRPIHDLILEDLMGHAAQTQIIRSEKDTKHHLITQDDQKNIVLYYFYYNTPPDRKDTSPPTGTLTLRVDCLGMYLPSALTTMLKKYHYTE